MQARHALGTNHAPHARTAAVASRAMRRSRRLALALSAVALAAPGLAHAATPATGTPAKPASPFAADRQASLPTGLTPDSVANPVRYPDQSVILAWGDVPGAAGYHVELSSNPGFTNVVWKGDTSQAVAVPDIVLPDGAYWWRVRAVDAAGTQGLWSNVARVAKSWPNVIAGTRVTATPGGPAVTYTALNPYLSWNPVPGAKSYDVEVSPGDQFNNVIFSGKDLPEPFASPAGAGALPDNTYGWRVRAKDANGNPGPWTVGTGFTKAWTAPVLVGPDDGATTNDLSLRWQPIQGAEQYEVQITDLQFNFVGPHLKVDATTAATGLTPTLQEQRAKGMTYGNLWWRVRPIISGVYGTWSEERQVHWQAPGSTSATPTLSSTGDSTTGLSPWLAWTPVTGASLYRIDIATDPQFNNVRESQLTTSTSWVSRAPLPDNQLGNGYYWRVIWGAGSTVDDPQWMVSEAAVGHASFRKQTQITLATPLDGGTVGASPLLSWSDVAGIAKYNVQLSQSGQFDASGTRQARVFGYGGVPGTLSSGEARLPEGTWKWRVRAVDGGDAGQTWSPIGTFTLSSPRPAQKSPGDGAVVVYSPLLTWSPVPGAVGYEVQVSGDPSFASTSGSSDVLATAQTALVPPKERVPLGLNYWRVRASFGPDNKGQWSVTRTFHSVRPPDFNLNSMPRRVDFQRSVVVSGQLKNNGAGVSKARLLLERRTWPSDAYRPAGTVHTNGQGRFAFSLRMTRSAAYRLVWAEEKTHPQGSAAFAIDVQPRLVFRLASSRVARKRGLTVKGSIFPRLSGVIQLKTSDGWTTLRKVSPSHDRFAVSLGTGRIVPGSHRLRLWVPQDVEHRFAPTASRQRGILVYDRFVIC